MTPATSRCAAGESGASSGLNLHNIPGMQDLRALTGGHCDVQVAVIDGMADMGHAALSGARLRLSGLWPVPEGTDTSVHGMHGTFVSSVLFGREQVAGVCPDCSGYLIPLLPPVRRVVPQLDLARAIEEAVEMGAHIVNLSAGQFSDSGAADDWLDQAVRLCRDNNVLLVAAAGNDGCDCLHVPASLPGVLAVGAMDEAGIPLDFSNWGEAYLQNGLLAPGKDILGAMPGGGVRQLSGTSFATPVVSGVAALLLSLQLQRGEKPDPGAVGRALLAGSERCTLQSADACKRWLVGKLDIAGAIQALWGPPTAIEPQPVPVEISVSAQPEAGVAASQWDALPMVFALGRIGYEFVSEARRDSFLHLMRQASVDGALAAPNPYQPEDMANYLSRFPGEASAVVWTLSLDHSPLYALQGVGAHADEIYAIFRQWLEQGRQLDRVSVAGRLQGQIQLVTGQWLPVLHIERPAGLWGWSLDSLVALQKPGQPVLQRRLREFAERVYYDLRNTGQSSAERALNFAATNLTQAHQALAEAHEQGMELADVRVEPCSFYRKDGDCWDVVLEFFDPERGGRGRLAYRLSLDVAELVPVTLGPVRSFRVAR